jgi:precorrin isomerase
VAAGIRGWFNLLPKAAAITIGDAPTVLFALRIFIAAVFCSVAYRVALDRLSVRVAKNFRKP